MKVVFLACNKYAWMVPVAMHFYKKYWPDNPYQTEIVTETNYIDGTVFYYDDKSWSNRLIEYLKQSKDDKFMLIMEEHFFEKPVNTKRIRKAESLCCEKIGCVRLNPTDKWFDRFAFHIGFKNFKEYPLNKMYSMSMQTAIWQKVYLLDVLRKDESIWQTEKDGSIRLKDLKPKWRILWAKKPIVDYTAGGLMKKGRPRLEVLQWALLDLIK